MTVRRLAMSVAMIALAFPLATGCSKPEAAAPVSELGEFPTPAKADNFVLTDQDGRARELYRMKDAAAVVLVIQGNGCPIVRNMWPGLKEVRDAYAAKGVEFLMVNSNIQDDRESIRAEAAEYGIDMPILKDAHQLVGEHLGVERTAEVFVIDPKTWQIVYHGPMDDRLTYERQKAEAANPYLRNALDAVLAGKPVEVKEAETAGCLVNFPERDRKAEFANISYVDTIAPIIEQKCVACHQPGGIGPFAFDTYEKVKGFSPMIREVLRTDRMPPWHADPETGTFKDDHSLSAEQITTLVHWIEAGAPRGEGADPLAAVVRTAPEWPLGKPDVVLNIPAYTIPASGVVDYQRPYVVNPVKETRWIRASSVRVTQRQGVHHILTGKMDAIPADGVARETEWKGSVGGYAVGSESVLWPENVGTELKPGGAIGFQMHYTPFGKEAQDASQIGLYFYDKDKEPDLVMHNAVVIDTSIEIPPNTEAHREIAYLSVPKDMILYSAFPHAHYRGSYSDLKIRYPDGTEKMLVVLPKYDFNWQREYAFAEPLDVPAGSKLIATYLYDNSARNKANPDPAAAVKWGDQSFEEMFYTAIRYRWKDETRASRVNHDEALNQSRLMGMLDDNIDGMVQREELRGRMGLMLTPRFGEVDRNGDGGLDAEELKPVMAFIAQQRRAAAGGSD